MGWGWLGGGWLGGEAGREGPAGKGREVRDWGGLVEGG